MVELLVTPSSHGRCKPVAADVDGAAGAALDDVATAFEREGAGEGLFRLALRRNADGLNPALAFWRDFAAVEKTNQRK